jgi:thymidylate kinase
MKNPVSQLPLQSIFKAPKVVIFEGISGSGKSTQIKKIERVLSQGGLEVSVHNSERVYPAVSRFRPTDVTQAAQAIQEAIFFRFTRWLTAVDADASDVALVDRFVFSDLIYLAQRLDALNVKYDINLLRQQMLSPFEIDLLEGSLTLLIDCPPSIAGKRSAQRSRNRFDINVQRAVRRISLAEILFVKENRVIDGARDENLVEEDVLTHILKYLNLTS